jgi:secondary thiamine-phosphate synthase enzyme
LPETAGWIIIIEDRPAASSFREGLIFSGNSVSYGILSGSYVKYSLVFSAPPLFLTKAAQEPPSEFRVLKIMEIFDAAGCKNGRFAVRTPDLEKTDLILRGSMKSYRQELWFETASRRAFINITSEVNQALQASGIEEGLILCNAMHITASVFINDFESGLLSDFETWLEKLAPEKPHSQYSHNAYEDNADAHLKRQIMGREVMIAVTGGQLDLGPWEQIFYGEFDGMRRKRVLIKIIGD